MKLSKQDQELYRAIETSIREAERSDVVHQLLMLSLGRVWFKHMKSAPQFVDVPATEQMMRFHAELQHIADWIEAAIVNDEPWLKNVDAQGRPKKLMKFSTLDQIVREADKAMLKGAQKALGIRLIEGAESLVAKLEDGFYIVELHTPAALDRESAYMQHCIGMGAYDNRLNKGSHRYLSLRDPAGKPHVTIELSRVPNLSIDPPSRSTKYTRAVAHVSEEAAPDGFYWTIMQYQGKQNRAPIAKYTDILVPYLKECKFGISSHANGLNYIVDRNLNWHPVSNLPDTLDIEVFILGAKNNEDDPRERFRLPKTLLNTSRIFLNQAIVEKFPAHDHVALRCLLLNSCVIDNFDANALTGENLELKLTNCRVNALPENINCMSATFHFESVKQWPQTIMAEKCVKFSRFDMVSTPMKLKSETISLGLGSNKYSEVNHKLSASKLFVSLIGDASALPRGINVEKLSIDLSTKPKAFSIPEGTKVLISLEIERFMEIEHLHIPDSIPDRVLLTDGNTTTMHVGEYRQQRKHAA